MQMVNTLVVERFRTKFTLVVRPDNFFRFFFEPVNLHSKLTNLFGVFGFFLAFFGKFFPEIVFPLVIKSKRSIYKEFLLPVAQEIWLNIVFNSKDIKFFFSFKQLEYEVGLKFSTEISS